MNSIGKPKRNRASNLCREHSSPKPCYICASENRAQPIDGDPTMIIDLPMSPDEFDREIAPKEAKFIGTIMRPNKPTAFPTDSVGIQMINDAIEYLRTGPGTPTTPGPYRPNVQIEAPRPGTDKLDAQIEEEMYWPHTGVPRGLMRNPNRLNLWLDGMNRLTREIDERAHKTSAECFGKMIWFVIKSIAGW